MKFYQFLFLTFTTIFFVNCQPDNSSTTTETATDTTTVVTTQPPVKEEPAQPASQPEMCYRYEIKRDTYELSFVRTGDDVKGRMIYKNYEKDSSEGDMTGRWNGNILNIWYTFQSEGMTSVAQHMFMKSGDNLIEGHGDIDMKGDTALFKDPAYVAYKDMIFKPIDCANKLKRLR